MFLGLYFKKFARMMKISKFFVFQGKLVFQTIEQAKLNWAFLQDMASRAKPGFLKGMASQAEPSQAELYFQNARAKNEPSQAELWLGPNTTTKLGDEKFQALFCLWRVMGNIGVGGIS